MDDLISRQAAIRAVEGWMDSLNPESKLYTAMRAAFNRSIHALELVPTADVVEVVRCKDCKWFYKTKKECGRSYQLPIVAPDFYCGYAERKI